jgi:hypothetical protein
MAKGDNAEGEQYAIISCVQPDGTFDIKYDDGEQKTGVRAETLRLYLSLLSPKTFGRWCTSFDQRTEKCTPLSMA